MAASIVDLPDPFLEQGLGSSSAAFPQPFPTALEPETAEAHSDETVPAAKVELKLRVLPSWKHQQPTYKHYKCEPFTTAHGAYKYAATGLDELLAVDTHGELPRPRPAALAVRLMPPYPGPGLGISLYALHSLHKIIGIPRCSIFTSIAC